jgi:CheY-like chemotaxis protein
VVTRNPRTVLIADDDPGIRESLTELLRRSGWETVTAEEGDEAVAIVRVRVVLVALVDLRMPGMSGLETVRALRRVSEPLPIVAMTADRDRWEREEVVAAGAVDLLWKPLHRDIVFRALEEALRSRDLPKGGGAANQGEPGSS